MIALLNKCIDFKKHGKPLDILSVTCNDTTDGLIYIEAFKEVHVK